MLSPSASFTALSHIDRSVFMVLLHLNSIFHGSNSGHELLIELLLEIGDLLFMSTQNGDPVGIME